LNQQALTVARRRWTVTREALAFTASVLLFPLGLKKSRRKTPRAAEQRTVVFIHGYLANRASFLPLGGYLAAKGYRSQLSFEYRPGDTIEQAAIKLKQFLKHHVRGGRIDLVCHSLGGLVARVYLQELGGFRRVDRCITIGTPHHGTYNAYWLWTRVGEDLRPNSVLLNRLESTKDNAACVKFLAIGGGADRIVLPPHHAQFAERNLHFPDIGHQGLLFSHSVFRQISQHLAG
jgi:pimeloyl-ACP methyl ester carboxylesterase